MKKFIIRAFNDRGELSLTSIRFDEQKEVYEFSDLEEARKLYDQEVNYLKGTHELADEFDEKDGNYIIVVIQEENAGEFVEYTEMSETFKLN